MEPKPRLTVVGAGPGDPDLITVKATKALASADVVLYDALVNEVVMQAGDLLYLPTNWFHYIISLDLNFQCNTRSGVGEEYMYPIRACGF